MKLSEHLGDLRRCWRAFALTHLLFTLLGIALLTPLFGALLQGLVSLSGNAAVADQDIARLVLSVPGLLAAIFIIGLALAIATLELGALQAIALAARHSVKLTAVQASVYSLRRCVPLLGVAIILTIRVLLYLLPALALLAVVAWWLLSAHDINYYLSSKPPQFYWALATVILVGLVLAWLLGRRLLRWSLVLPLVLFGDTSPTSAFARSEALTEGRQRELMQAFLTWLAVSAGLILIPHLFLALTTGWAFSGEQHALPPILLLLGAVALVWTVLNFLAGALVGASFTILVAAIYTEVGPPLSAKLVKRELLDSDPVSSRNWNPGIVTLAIVLAAVVSLLFGVQMMRNLKLEDSVLVVAHRGAAGSAPENTLAAINQAITDGADWVEIDVQETRDGEVIVVHDSDFMKLAGDSIKVWEADLERIREIDVGGWFAKDFIGETVPTLAQVLETIKGRSKLVIELKYYGHDQQLEQRVVDLVEAAGMTDDVVIMSLKLAGINKLQALRPEWTTGLLAATALGDLTRLDVDFLAVNANIASPAFIRRAHATGKQVFVWTVNDALSLSRWMSMGVDGVITDEPALARRILHERTELSSVERLLLSAGFFFGTPKVPAKYRDNSP